MTDQTNQQSPPAAPAEGPRVSSQDRWASVLNRALALLAEHGYDPNAPIAYPHHVRTLADLVTSFHYNDIATSILTATHNEFTRDAVDHFWQAIAAAEESQP